MSLFRRAVAYEASNSPAASPTASSSSSSSSLLSPLDVALAGWPSAPLLPKALPPELEEAVRRVLAVTDLADFTASGLPPPPPRPQVPLFTPKMGSRQRIHGIQRFISSFEYNLTGTNYFLLRKDRGLRKIAITAKDIIREALPIKCIEVRRAASGAAGRGAGGCGGGSWRLAR